MARLEDGAGVAAEAAGGMPGTAAGWGRCCSRRRGARWIARAAAQAILSFAASRAAAVAGSYEAVNPADVWPGDVLALTADGSTMSVIVRRVTIVDGAAMPEVLRTGWSLRTTGPKDLGLCCRRRLRRMLCCRRRRWMRTGQCAGEPAAVTGGEFDGDCTAGGRRNGASYRWRFEVRRRDWDFGAGSGPGPGAAEPGEELLDSARGAGGAVLRADVRCFDSAGVFAVFERGVYESSGELADERRAG